MLPYTMQAYIVQWKYTIGELGHNFYEIKKPVGHTLMLYTI